MSDIIQEKATNPRISDDEKLMRCRPFTSSFFEVESQILIPGALIQIQHYRWDQPMPIARFTPAAHYIDFSITPRSPSVNGSLKLGGKKTPWQLAGDSVFIPAGAELHTTIAEGDQCVLACMFDPDLALPFFDFVWTTQNMSSCLNIRNTNIKIILRRLTAELLSPGFSSNLLVDGYMNALMAELARHIGNSRNPNKWMGRLTPQQKQLIEDRVLGQISNPPQLEELAELCGVTVRHLTRAYKNTTGITLGEFIASEQIAFSKQLLSTPDILIKSVAYSAGFKSSAAFSAAFRRASGVSPQEYRLTFSQKY